MKHRIIHGLACLLLLAGCGKTWRSHSQPEQAAEKAPGSLEHWAGRADFTTSNWLIKPQP